MQFVRILVVLLIAAAAVSAQTVRKPATPVFRTISIVSEPGAKVWLDGVYFGKVTADGSLTIKTVSTGVHRLRLRLDGFSPKEQAVAATQRGDVTISLSKTTDKAELAYQEAERLALEDREKSVAKFKQAIELRPNFPDAYLAMARVQIEADELDDALGSITTARKLRPAFAEASAVEGRIHKELGDDAKAIAAFKRAITEGKGFQPEAYTGLGLFYKAKAETEDERDTAHKDALFAEATKNLKIALKQLSGAPDAIVIYQLLGLAYERNNQNAEAIAVYEEFLKLFPDTPEATSVRSFIVQLKKSDQ